jgi:hypothetical protein
MVSKANPVNGIFLLYGGLPQTVIESQVFVHAQLMREFDITMEVWIFAVGSKSFLIAQQKRHQLSKDYNVTVRVFKCVRLGLPFSPWFNALLLLFHIVHNHISPAFIHGRTEYAALVAVLVKRIFPVKVVWDARGDSLSELIDSEKRNSFPWRFLLQLRVWMLDKRIRLTAKRCDVAMFVSEQLYKLQGCNIPKERTFIVPCLADENLFYLSNTLREKKRQEMGYKHNDIVVIYVGSTAPWQCVSETVAFMEKAMRLNPLVKVLVITSDKDKFELLFSKDIIDQIFIKTVALKEVNNYLNAADYGIMLREHSPINYVASPVKFSEYSLTGLTVITTTAVDQVNKYGGILGNTISQELFISKINGAESITDSRKAISTHAKLLLSRGARVDISLIYK